MKRNDFTPSFETYSRKYQHIRMTRREGILELCLHSKGESLKWTPLVHEELGYCFGDVANDPDNKVVILTGEGSVFCSELDVAGFDLRTMVWPDIQQEGKRLLTNLLGIDVPVIGAVNGPAHVHAELVLLSNVVIASRQATFQDAIHFTRGWVPGDGAHAVWPALLGPTRGSYFLVTGQMIDAEQALALGIVHEIMPQGEVKARAWSIAEEIARQPLLVRRYTRNLATHEMKRLMHDQLSHGLALEGVAYLAAAEGSSE
jgi:enoyl-CoA hydratase/carnithine racemase